MKPYNRVWEKEIKNNLIRSSNNDDIDDFIKQKEDIFKENQEEILWRIDDNYFSWMTNNKIELYHTLEQLWPKLSTVNTSLYDILDARCIRPQRLDSQQWDVQEIWKNYAKAMRRHNDRVLGEERFAYHIKYHAHNIQYKNSFVFWNYDQLTWLFFVSHFAPSSIREWVELLKYLLTFDNICFTVPAYLAQQLYKLWYADLDTQLEMDFAWQTTTKHLFVSSPVYIASMYKHLAQFIPGIQRRFEERKYSNEEYNYDEEDESDNDRYRYDEWEQDWVREEEEEESWADDNVEDWYRRGWMRNAA